ncbi:MAG TPA: hypothetical protein VFQ25_04550 [Ktedonobacterales bacterium]|nr:hypothetical protein [Ktedonobacterales bacterium]
MIRHSLRRVGLLAPLVALLALAACGSQGYAPALGKAATTTLDGAQPGSLTLTPIYATHVVTYYLGKLIPSAGAQTPVELRKGSCSGPVIATLTEAAAAPAPSGAPIVAPGAANGANVAAVVDENVYIVIRARANDPNAAQLACGAPLSSRRQYFDLYTPGQGRNGPQLGLTLIEPIVATRAETHLTAPAAIPLTWAVYAGGCHGAALAQGQIAQGATTSYGVIFQSAPASGWSVSLAPVKTLAPPPCQKVSG